MKTVLLILLLTVLSCSHSQKKKSLLLKIKQRDVLLVGTTGDYAPFSEWKDGQFQGIDIEMAQSLAQSLNVKLKLVKTSWPNLLNDLKNNNFDIAMSGVSIKPERKEVGFFSNGYIQYGKMGISLCKKAQQFTTLKKIDQPHVRVIVNPGGTNYSFTKKNIKNAKITVYPNNAEIFDQILNGHADVMMTDSVEVYYQSKKHKNKLCPTMKSPMTKNELAYFMPQDEAFRNFVNFWLKKISASGQKETITKKYF